MIPYIEAPVFHIGSFSFSAFSMLVSIAVLSGYAITIHRLKKTDIPYNDGANFFIWVIISAFIFSHLFAVLAYRPHEAWENPWILLDVFGHMSSFGGMFGGIFGGILFLYIKKQLSTEHILRYLDIIAYAFPFGWIFGRAGCSIVHDHPGIPSTHWLAVQFPGGPRFDLGLLELLFTIFIALLVYILGKRQRPNGFFLALFFVLYGPVRFYMDTLRTADVRYWDWTPGQFMALLMTLGGLLLLARIYHKSKTRIKRA